MRSNITIVIKYDDNFDISSLKFLPIENIAINQNIEISPNPMHDTSSTFGWGSGRLCCLDRSLDH